MIEPLYHDGSFAAVRLISVPPGQIITFEIDLAGCSFGAGGLRVWRNDFELTTAANPTRACHVYPLCTRRGKLCFVEDLAAGDVLVVVDERDRTETQNDAAWRAVSRWRGQTDAR